VSQVVILTAGMDARAYRLPWRAGTTVYEVDQPQVIAPKDERLAGERPRCRRVAVDIDLADGWPKALQSQGFSLSAKTVWLVEGLLQYLDAWAVGTLGVGTTSAASRSDFSTTRAVLSNRMRQATVPAPAWTNVWEAMVPALMTGLGLSHADRQGVRRSARLPVDPLFEEHLVFVPQGALNLDDMTAGQLLGLACVLRKDRFSNPAVRLEGGGTVAGLVDRTEVSALDADEGSGEQIEHVVSSHARDDRVEPLQDGIPDRCRSVGECLTLFDHVAQPLRRLIGKALGGQLHHHRLYDQPGLD
jgi:hypothetical protein